MIESILIGYVFIIKKKLYVLIDYLIFFWLIDVFKLEAVLKNI